MSVALKWISPNAEQLIVDIARVSTDKPEGEPGENLIKYLIKHGHWSPFEMANMCVEINTTRDIAHQLIRHRSFSFQEFSQRYSKVKAEPIFRQARLQDNKNRQASIELDPNDDRVWDWNANQYEIWNYSYSQYEWALDNGLAKECARAILPEGITPTRMFMNGNIRSWIHFYQARSYEGAQKEIRLIAYDVGDLMKEHLPVIWSAMNDIS